MFRFDPYDTIAIDAIRYNCVHQTRKTCILQRMDEPDAPLETFSDIEISMLRKSNRWRYFPCLETRNRLSRKIKDNQMAMTTASPDDRQKAIFLYMQIMAMEQLYEAGCMVRTPASFDENWEAFEAIVKDREAARKLCGRVLKAGEALPVTRKLHSASTILRKATKLRKNHFDIGCLLSQQGQRASNNTSFSEETEQFVGDYIRNYADPDQPKKSHIAIGCIKALKEENERRLGCGEEQLKVPCQRTIERRIDRLDPFEVAVFRIGFDQARRSLAAASRGIKSQYPLERVELDAWRVDLRTFFAKMGLLPYLPKEIRDSIPRGRRWIYAAIDCATRVVLGIKVVENPSAEEALKAFAMCSIDKTDYAEAVGAEKPWSFYGAVHQLCCDTGSDFISDEFVTGVNLLGSAILFAPVKVPEMRGKVERLFGTFARQLMPRLTGRTFSSVQERGDHASESRAVLDDDDLTRILTLYVVDHYHHQPHAGLGGQTPASRWAELANDFGVSEPPDSNTRRVAVGIEFTRKPSKMGVVLYSNHYSCPELHTYRRKNPRKALRVRIDPANIGAVSIELDGAWYQASALNGEEFEGVSLPEWINGMRAIRKTYAREALLSLAVRNAAIKKIKAINDAARKRAQLAPTEFSKEQLVELEKRLCGGTMFDHPIEPPAPSGDAPFGHKVYPASPSAPDVVQTDQPDPSDNQDGDWDLED